MNNELYMQILRGLMRENGLQTKGLLLMEYRRDLSIKDETKFKKLKEQAKARTLELQDKYPTMLSIDRTKLHKDWINDILK